MVDTWDDCVIGMIRSDGKNKVVGLFNFSGQDRIAWINEEDGMYRDLLSGREMEARGVQIPAYGYYWLAKLPVEEDPIPVQTEEGAGELKEQPEKVETVEAEKAIELMDEEKVKTEKAAKPEVTVKAEKTAKPEATVKTEKTAKPEKAGKTVKTVK